MSSDEKDWAFRLLIMIGVVFVGSTVFAYRELTFVVSGRTTSATVESIEKVRLRRIRETLVHYAYQDADGRRTRARTPWRCWTTSRARAIR